MWKESRGVNTFSTPEIHECKSSFDIINMIYAKRYKLQSFLPIWTCMSLALFLPTVRDDFSTNKNGTPWERNPWQVLRQCRATYGDVNSVGYSTETLHTP
jgi:hypothetical protein